MLKRRIFDPYSGVALQLAHQQSSKLSDAMGHTYCDVAHGQVSQHRLTVQQTTHHLG